MWAGLPGGKASCFSAGFKELSAGRDDPSGVSKKTQWCVTFTFSFNRFVIQPYACGKNFTHGSILNENHRFAKGSVP